ncbi:MAG: sulfite exporter TauE/SafE family protein [Chitinophaga sp.]|uniref:sulfite exporter TauE/SafE family protein n=1 Tax=Chitinophaga sp. TaxID=1869181 RepID=UPI001B2BC0AD|nr:sulfite exporter TauE/SafE family protein [Chitinophaga sp.]MBO9733001.1 sulfite exporter TauE/SafE family protein [Chitinophaga sp.]
MEVIGYIASVFIGLSLGLVGGGGSILTVPILVYFFHIDPLIATTYSLFIVGLTSAVGAGSHFRKGNVDFKIALIFGVPSLAAVFVMRKWVMPAIPEHLLQVGDVLLSKSVLLMLVFAILMVFAAIAMMRKSKNVVVPAAPVSYTRLMAQGVAVGLITGFVGVGGGFLIIPSLVLFGGLSMKKAVGTSLMVMTISSLLGMLGDLSRHAAFDYLFLVYFSLFAVGGIIAGSYLTKYTNDAKLKPVFGWFVLVMGIFILISTLYNQ